MFLQVAVSKRNRRCKVRCIRYIDRCGPCYGACRRGSFHLRIFTIEPCFSRMRQPTPILVKECKVNLSVRGPPTSRFFDICQAAELECSTGLHIGTHEPAFAGLDDKIIAVGPRLPRRCSAAIPVLSTKQVRSDTSCPRGI